MIGRRLETRHITCSQDILVLRQVFRQGSAYRRERRRISWTASPLLTQSGSTALEWTFQWSLGIPSNELCRTCNVFPEQVIHLGFLFLPRGRKLPLTAHFALIFEVYRTTPCSLSDRRLGLVTAGRFSAGMCITLRPYGLIRSFMTGRRIVL